MWMRCLILTIVAFISDAGADDGAELAGHVVSPLQSELNELSNALIPDETTRRCWAHSTLKIGETLSAQVDVPSDCNRQRDKGVRTSTYRITRLESGFRVSLNYFIFDRTPGKMARTGERQIRFNALIDCVKKFYARQGIEFDPTFAYGKLFDAVPFATDRSFELSDYVFGMNEGSLALMASFAGGPPKGPLPLEQMCAGWAHELGHTLGLLDTYLSEDCPDRKVAGPSWDVMARGSALPADQVRFTEDQVWSLLKPACLQ